MQAIIYSRADYVFANGLITIGQKCRAISREVLRTMLVLCQCYFAEGKTCDHVLELRMPVYVSGALGELHFD
jgi:hypothetical protein